MYISSNLRVSDEQWEHIQIPIHHSSPFNKSTQWLMTTSAFNKSIMLRNTKPCNNLHKNWFSAYLNRYKKTLVWILNPIGIHFYQKNTQVSMQHICPNVYYPYWLNLNPFNVDRIWCRTTNSLVTRFDLQTLPLPTTF